MQCWSCDGSLTCWAGGITVDRAVESEQPTQRRRLVLAAMKVAGLQFRNQGVHNARQVVGKGARSQSEAGDAGRLPIAQEIGKLSRRSGGDECVAGVDAGGPGRP